MGFKRERLGAWTRKIKVATWRDVGVRDFAWKPNLRSNSVPRA